MIGLLFLAFALVMLSAAVAVAARAIAGTLK